MRLEFKLKKTSKKHWKRKVLLVFLLGVILFSLYLSPVGQKGKQWIRISGEKLAEKADWRLNQVIVEGHKRTDKQAVLKVLGIKQNQPMGTISLSKAREKLLTLPWVRNASVERYLPDTLVIRMTEKTPIALWQNHQVYQPLDELGKPISDNQLLPADLILVVGSDAPQNTLALLTALEQVPSISHLVRSAVRVEKRRWNLHLLDAEKGLKIMLPETNFDQALKRLVSQKENLLKKNVDSIDLRLKDRIILHPKKALQVAKGKK